MAQQNGDERPRTPDARDGMPMEEGTARTAGRAEIRADDRADVRDADRERGAEGEAMRAGRDVGAAGDAGGTGDDDRERTRRLETAAADTREPELAREIRDSDNDRTESRQSRLEAQARAGARQLDRSGRGRDLNASEIADTRERVRELSAAADTLAQEVDSLRRRTQRIAANVRRTEVREIDDATGDDRRR